MLTIRIAVRREKLPRVWRLAWGLTLAVTPMAFQVGFVRFLLASKVWESLRS